MNHEYFRRVKPLSVVTLPQIKTSPFTPLFRNAVHISVSSRVEVPVEFADTGHPFLDSKPMKHPKDHVSRMCFQNGKAAELLGIGWDREERAILFFFFFDF